MKKVIRLGSTNKSRQVKTAEKLIFSKKANKLVAFIFVVLVFALAFPALASTGPDLRVTRITHPVVDPVVDKRIDFNVSVKNFGDAESRSSRVMLRIDEDSDGSYEKELTKFVSSLDPGEGRDYPFSWTPNIAGPHTVEAIADVNNTVEESNEDNNRLTQSFNVDNVVIAPTASVELLLNESSKTLTLTSGASVTLSWTSSNASSCRASGNWSGTKPTSGSELVGPLTSSSSFSINCGGATDSVDVSISSGPAPSGARPSIDIRAVPSRIDEGESALIVWNVTNADKCVASGAWSGSKSDSGNRNVKPKATAQYVLVCSNDFGSNSNFAIVGVDDENETDELEFSFRANPTLIKQGESAALVWATNNADSCIASGDWSGNKPDSGTANVSPNKTSTYTLSCAGDGEISTLSRTIRVSGVSTGQTPRPRQNQNFNLACVVSPRTASVGQSVSYAAGQTGGVNPVSFTWSGDVSGTTQTRTVRFGSPGIKSVQLNARDGLGRLATASCSVANILAGATVGTSLPPSNPPVRGETAPEFLSYGGITVPSSGAGVEGDGNKPIFASVFSPSSFGNLLWYLFLLLLNIGLLIGLWYAGREVYRHHVIPTKNGNGSGNGNNYHLSRL